MENNEEDAAIQRLYTDFQRLGLTPVRPDPDLLSTFMMCEESEALEELDRIATRQAVIRYEIRSRLGRMFKYGRGKMMPRYKLIESRHPDDPPFELSEHEWSSFDAFASVTASVHILCQGLGGQLTGKPSDYERAFEVLRELHNTRIHKPLSDGLSLGPVEVRKALLERGHEAAAAYVFEVTARMPESAGPSFEDIRKLMTSPPKRRNANRKPKGRKLFAGEEPNREASALDVWAVLDFLDAHRDQGPSIQFTYNAQGRFVLDTTRIKTAFDRTLGEKEPKPWEVLCERLEELDGIAFKETPEAVAQAEDSLNVALLKLRAESPPESCMRLLIDHFQAIGSGSETLQDVAREGGFAESTVLANWGNLRRRLADKMNP